MGDLLHTAPWLPQPIQCNQNWVCFNEFPRPSSKNSQRHRYYLKLSKTVQNTQDWLPWLQHGRRYTPILNELELNKGMMMKLFGLILIAILFDLWLLWDLSWVDDFSFHSVLCLSSQIYVTIGYIMLLKFSKAMEIPPTTLCNQACNCITSRIRWRTSKNFYIFGKTQLGLPVLCH